MSNDLSQLADDTVITQRNTCKGLNTLLTRSSLCTKPPKGMKINASKAEGLLLSELRGCACAHQSPRVKWCKGVEWLIFLVGPQRNSFNELDFRTQRYHKYTALTAGLRDLNAIIIPWGRAILANNLLLSRFLYSAQVHPPAILMKENTEYVAALVCNKSCQFFNQW